MSKEHHKHDKKHKSNDKKEKLLPFGALLKKKHHHKKEEIKVNIKEVTLSGNNLIYNYISSG